MGLSLVKVFKTELHVLSTLYREIGLLGVVCRVIGQFPVHASLSGDILLMRFSLLSPATLYSVFCSSLPLMVYWYINKFFKPFYLAKNTLLLTFNTTQVVIQIFSFLTGWSALFGLLDALERFDSQLYKVPILTKVRRVDSKSLIWITALVCQSLWAILASEFYGPEHRFLMPILILVRVIFYIPHLLQSTLFFFFCSQITSRMICVQTSWLLYLKAACTHNQGKSTLRLDHYRSLHVELRNCASCLNQAFAFKLAAICATLFVSVLLSTHLMYSSHMKGGGLPEKIWFFILVILIGFYAARLRVASHLMLDKMFELEIRGLNNCLRSQMDLLAYQLDRSKITISVPGVVVFSRQFIGSFISALVTYFILVTQATTQFEQ